ncbi:unnamed protein product [Clonostachys rosea]|uniref:NAD-dependent epimerase/dehydratase domain-containing protein n=1 Tax=Bionectria ochroleuca TaxID=29856 RepID=A0ABY6U424_BIOOC|nr:unnamed protein product [Clonostachys rosea]
MNDTSSVVHVISDLSFSDDPNTVIPWMAESTKILLSAANSCPSIQRVVLTSSCSSVITTTPGESGVRIDEGMSAHTNKRLEIYNDADVEVAWDPNTPMACKAYSIHAASKARGEQEACKWVRKHKPHFVFNTVLPTLITGNLLHPNISGSTMSWIRELPKGHTLPFSLFPARRCLNVIDTARLHCIALLSPDVSSQRLFAFGKPTSIGNIIQELRKLQPNNSAIPDAPESEFRDGTEVPPDDKAKTLLRSHFGQGGWTSLRSSLQESSQIQ